MASVPVTIAATIAGLLVVATAGSILLDPGLRSTVLGLHAEATLSCGVAGWGTGDESLRLRHAGGHAFSTDDLQIRVYPGSEPRRIIDLPTHLVGSTFEPGETLTLRFTASEPQDVRVQVVHQASLGAWIAWEGNARPNGCKDARLP